jgi:hypothetical protein
MAGKTERNRGGAVLNTVVSILCVVALWGFAIALVRFPR